MELSDRDGKLLAFANLASHGIAARPATASDAAGLAAELGARHPGGLGSYVFWHRDDDASFDPTGTLTAAALTLHCSGEESLTAARGVPPGRRRRRPHRTAPHAHDHLTHGPAPTGRRTHPTPAWPPPRALSAVALPPLGRPPPRPDGPRNQPLPPIPE
jgi:hypothetical protein